MVRGNCDRFEKPNGKKFSVDHGIHPRVTLSSAVELAELQELWGSTSFFGFSAALEAPEISRFSSIRLWGMEERNWRDSYQAGCLLCTVPWHDLVASL